MLAEPFGTLLPSCVGTLAPTPWGQWGRVEPSSHAQSHCWATNPRIFDALTLHGPLLRTSTVREARRDRKLETPDIVSKHPFIKICLDLQKKAVCGPWVRLVQCPAEGCPPASAAATWMAVLGNLRAGEVVSDVDSRLCLLGLKQAPCPSQRPLAGRRTQRRLEGVLRGQLPTK